MKKLLSIILAVCIFALPLACGFGGFAIKSDAADIDFRCGENATWYLDTQGVLTISGTGDMYDFNGVFSKAPWHDFRASVKSVVIEEGITSIGMYAFAYCSKAQKIHIASSVEFIRAGAFGFGNDEVFGTIKIGENSMLKAVDGYALSDTVWYDKQTYGKPVYLGRMLYIVRGAIGETVEVKEGTIAISNHAFYNSGVAEIILPDSVEYVGQAALIFNDWYDNQPDGPIYSGKVLCGYKGELPIEEIDYKIKDGTKAIAAGAFANCSRLFTVTIPKSVKTIGIGAFQKCYNLTNVYFEESCELCEIGGSAFADSSKLTAIDLPQSVESIGDSAFSSTAITELKLGKNVRRVGMLIANYTSVEYVAVDDENPYFCSVGGALYSKDKSVLVYIPRASKIVNLTVEENCKYIRKKACEFTEIKTLKLNNGLEYVETYAFYFSELVKVNIPGTVKAIGYAAFLSCKISDLKLEYGITAIGDSFMEGNSYITEVEIPSSVTSIDRYAFGSCSKLAKAVIPASVTSINSYAFSGSNNVTIYCYENSAAHTLAQNKSIPFVLLDETVDSEEIESLMSQAGKIDRNLYTADSLAQLDEALGEVDLETEGLTQSQIEEWKTTIEEALENLKYKPADYSSLDELTKTVQTIDRGLYTEESLAELDKAINAVDYNLTVDKQSQVEEWKTAIEEALENLKYKPADYSSLDELTKTVQTIDRSLYTEESLAELDKSINAVDYDLTVDKQSQIEEWKKAIEEALENLKYKPADYSSLDELTKTAQTIDRGLYTEESLAELDKAINAVDYDLTVDKQSQVEEWKKAIEEALENLRYRPADYSEVNTAVINAQSIDRRYFSSVSLAVLDNAVNAVDYSLNITQQSTVDGYAKNIETAILSLEYASVVLRHDVCGVIVSATTREINPDTVLAVEMVDSSEHEGTNFAVGGSIRSLHFYDINLVRGSETVQPGGTVTVKIKLADGVDPAKCKVYHVTDDIVNPLVRFANTIDGNYVVFETDHFSEFAVIEVDTVLDGIEITQLPAKVQYSIGEQLDCTGLEVKALFSDGTQKDITDYSVGMVNLNSVGVHKITVYYTFGAITKTVSFDVSVYSDGCKADITQNGKSVERINKKLGLFALYTRASVELDCEVSNAEGCTLRWKTDNSKVFVDENGRVTCKGLFGAKKANVTVEVVDGKGNVVARDTVTVIFYKLSFQLSRLAEQAVAVVNKSFENMMSI